MENTIEISMNNNTISDVIVNNTKVNLDAFVYGKWDRSIDVTMDDLYDLKRDIEMHRNPKIKVVNKLLRLVQKPNVRVTTKFMYG